MKASAEFWMNLQIKYDIDLIKRKNKQSLEKTNLPRSKKSRLRKHTKAA